MNKNAWLAAALFCLLVLPAAAHAIPTVPCIPGLPCDTGTGSNGGFIEVVLRLIRIFLGIIAIIAVIVIIIAGFRLIISGGNEETLRAARRMILYAVIGLVIILLSVIIVNFVISLFPESGSSGGASPTPTSAP